MHAPSWIYPAGNDEQWQRAIDYKEQRIELLEDYAYHQRQKAMVICPASLKPMWENELRSATISAYVVTQARLAVEDFDLREVADVDVMLVDEAHNFRNRRAKRYCQLENILAANGRRGRDGGRIDRLGSLFDTLSIYNMFPERALEELLGLVRSLTAKIEVVNQTGFLDASILGEVVTPRDFNTLKRIADGPPLLAGAQRRRAAAGYMRQAIVPEMSGERNLPARARAAGS